MKKRKASAKATSRVTAIAKEAKKIYAKGSMKWTTAIKHASTKLKKSGVI